MKNNNSQNLKVVVIRGERKTLEGPISTVISEGFVTDVYLDEKGKRVNSLGFPI